MPRLDVSAWNLFGAVLAAAAASGCGGEPTAEELCAEDPDCECLTDDDCESPNPHCVEGPQFCSICMYNSFDECDIGRACTEDYEACVPAPFIPHCESSFDLAAAVPLPAAGVIRLAHVDDDSLLDVLVADGEAVKLVSGPADGPPTVLATAPGSTLSDVAAAEMTGDSSLDLIATAAHEGTWLFEGDGAGSFAEIWNDPARTGAQLGTGDFDGDGNVDVALIDYGGYSDVLVAPTGGGIPLEFDVVRMHTNDTRQMVVADFIDGPADELATAPHCLHECGRQRYSGLKHDGAAFAHVSLGVASIGITAAIAVELESGGGKSLIGVGFRESEGQLNSPFYPQLQRLHDSGEGELEMREIWLLDYLDVSYPMPLAAGDINGDGILDFATATEHLVIVQYRDGPASDSGCTVSYAIPHDATQLLAGDLDGDGRDELVFSDRSAMASVLGLEG